MSPRRMLFQSAGGLLHGLGLFRWLHRRRLPNAVSVVMYHGLVREPLPVPDWCFVSADCFESQVEYLARHFRVLHLEEALDPARPPADRPVACITFDDGFASVHDIALPILERLSLPAAAFVVAGLIDRPETVWSARLHQEICATAAIEVRVLGRTFELGSVRARTRASAQIQELLKALAPDPFDETLAATLTQLSGEASGAGPVWEPFRVLRSAEVRRLSRDDLVRVGAHTFNNQILTRVTPERAWAEVLGSVSEVSALVARPSSAFAYPNGTEDDFDENAISALRAAGIRYGLTTIEGPNLPPLDPYRVRRYGVYAGNSLARFSGLVHHVRAVVGWRSSTLRHDARVRGTAESSGEGHTIVRALSPEKRRIRRTSVAVAICTHYRNGPLETLLRAVVESAERIADRAAVGVVVVDDTQEGCARDVARRFEGRFELGVHYAVSGLGNISVARNKAIDAAAGIAEWVAMTDDDCEPEPGWLDALLEVQQATGAEAVAGRYRRRVPPGAPSWLTDEPFLDVALIWGCEDGAPLDMAGTNNSLLSSRWWREHPEIRFASRLGVAGGEDVVFYRTAHAAGLRIRAAPRAVVWEEQPPARTSLRYQLWHFFWLGNSSFVTRKETRQASALRMLLQGGNQVRRGLVRPALRLARGRSPQLRYSLATILNGVGQVAGVLGVRVSHH
jgi:succinoglycan biosynthesis protein ExoM